MNECKPLYTLSEVFDWKEKDEDWNRYVVPLTSRTKFCYSGKDFTCCNGIGRSVKISRDDAAKTLVCHDMKGGYLNDKYVDGPDAANSNEYTFCHWSVIDIFVYFSHHLVTIPPLMWINAAHRNGVQILGTLITEFEDGRKVWTDLFNGGQPALDKFADQLCTICAHYNFDGYLVNIENRIDRARLDDLKRFLERLKRGLNENCIVIWYDSVSMVTGELRWQNELNAHNKDAFAVCDGIFLNYCWKRGNLTGSALRSGARHRDVFVGVDVFGRGCYGGGGFDTCKAAALARFHGLSLALFGVGWTFEVETCKAVSEPCSLAAKQQFLRTERKFWSKLWRFLFVSGPASLPFSTSFDRGSGENVFRDGTLVCSGPWYNLSSQSYQSALTFCLNDETENACISHTDKDGFQSGGCISFANSTERPLLCNLLICDFVCEKTNPVTLSVASKWPIKHEEPYKLVLTVEEFNGRHRGTVGILINSPSKVSHLPRSSPVKYRNLDDYSSLSGVSKFISHSVFNGWLLSKHLLTMNGRITAIKIEINRDVLIGSLSLEYK